jgi:hypothetical protein
MRAAPKVYASIMKANKECMARMEAIAASQAREAALEEQKSLHIVSSDDDDLEPPSDSDVPAPETKTPVPEPKEPRRITRSTAQVDLTVEAKPDERERVDWEKLNDRGYIILKRLAWKYIKAHTLDDIQRNNSIVTDLSNGHTQPQETGENRTGGRWQMPFSTITAAGQQLRDDVMAMLTRLFPTRKFSTLLTMGARKNCLKQDPHTDADPSKTDIFEEQLLSAMICVQKGSSLVVYKGSHKWIRHTSRFVWKGQNIRRTSEPRRSTTLRLDIGDVVLWRGDLVHSGDGYTVPNIRLFNYVLPTNYVEPRDENGELEYLTYPVELKEETGEPGADSSEDA